ncbi:MULTISPECIES: epimerase [unclassified Microbacterium]|uniref:epimerase n=1 Tax=unclassified Microbacterium TaxID=2609290 RepID=UPI003659DD6F
MSAHEDGRGRVVLGGSTGFIGQDLARRWRAAGREVVTISRHDADLSWDDQSGIDAAVDGAGLVVGLAGRSVNCRYTPANRAEIFRSRERTTAALHTAIGRAATPPPLWANSSTATIYRHAEDRAQTEASGEPGTGFSVEVAKAWERALFAGDLPGTRRVALRTAIVLGDGGVLGTLRTLARFGLGGTQYDGHWLVGRARREAGTAHDFRVRGGRQRFSWVHLDDLAGIIAFLEDHPALEGPVNVVAPGASDNRTLMATIRRALDVPFGLPQPRWMLELGAIGIRTETELILKSRWVAPEKLLAAGYAFAHPDLDEAVRASFGLGAAPSRDPDPLPSRRESL